MSTFLQSLRKRLACAKHRRAARAAAAGVRAGQGQPGTDWNVTVLSYDGFR